MHLHSFHNAQTDIVALAGSAPPATDLNIPALTLHQNGHQSPYNDSINASEDAPHESESDLSDPKDALPAAVTSLSTATSPDHQSDFDIQDAESLQSDDDDARASEDADYEMDQSPPPLQNSPSQASASPASPRPSSKRKAVHDGDDYIKANPELYGLRRSVCMPATSTAFTDIIFSKARPVQQKAIVCHLYYSQTSHILTFHR